VCAQPFATLLSESGQQGRRHRDPKAAAQLAREVEEARPLSELLGTQVGDGNLGQRDEDEAEAHATQDHG
jgi:hypothetical protein